jgi:tetratricopeptide (TPR) repeat protein
MIDSEHGDVLGAMDNLSAALVLGTTPDRSGASAVRGTRIRDAFLEYEAGQKALAEWDLDGAARHFGAAMELDPKYAHAGLMRAQVMQWAGASPAEWRLAASQAVLNRERLDERERLLANALLALAEGRVQQACEPYRAIVARDSLDFAAWYGLGACQVGDPLVERDPRSPSGWRFRGSWHSGILAYARAMKLLPSFHRAQRTVSPLPTDLFPVEPRIFRRGYALTPDTIRFAAQPAMEADTLATVPRPAQEVLDHSGSVSFESNTAALAWSRRQLRDVADVWAQAFPESPLTHEALGAALEAEGRVAEAALAYRASRLRATDPPMKTRLGTDHVRLLVKDAQWDAARELADSMLATTANAVSVDDAWYLSGLAALTGHVARTRELMEVRSEDSARTFFSRGQPLVMPRQLTRAALAALTYASFPAPSESLPVLMRRVNDIIDRSVEPARRDEMRRAVLSLPTTFGFWQLDPASALRVDSPTALHRMQRAFARGQPVRPIADSAHARRESSRTSSSLIDFVFHEALVLLAIGDTAVAVTRLDAALDGLPTASAMLIADVHRAAAIPAAMVLRARLAAHARDTAVARRWSEGAAALWKGADPELRHWLDDAIAQTAVQR